ncbi:MAG TPA: Ig-like domain-containing protein [Gemmatimonadales bacterium]|jgi:hypothetical protein
MTLVTRLALAGTMMLAIGCGSSSTDGSGNTSPVSVATITITGSPGVISVSQTAQLTATLHDSANNFLTGRTISWGSSAPSIATVSSTGLVTAVSAGAVRITAASGGSSGTADLTISPTVGTVANVTIDAQVTTLNVGDTLTLIGTARDAQGNALPGHLIAWSATGASVLTVSSSGVVSATGAGTGMVTAASEGKSGSITLHVNASTSQVEERILAQQGLAIALASTVLQSQLYTLIGFAGDESDHNCNALPGGGALRIPGPTTPLPAVINFYFDTACAHQYMSETVTAFTGDDDLGNYHIVASAAYSSPAGTTLGTITFDEQALGIGQGSSDDQLTGTINGLGTYTSPGGAQTVHLGLNCDLGAGGHVVGICQGGIVQNFSLLGKAFGSVTTLALDSTTAGTLTLAGTSLLTSGNVNALTLTQPTPTSMVVNGGSAYGNTTDTGGAASFTLFPPQPTGWTVADSANDAIFTISVTDNTTRNLAGTIKRISTGGTLATIALDQSGTGTILYSDGTQANVTGWMLSQ